MAIFTLKYRDTRPILEVALLNPDGTAFDLTGSTSWKLHIMLFPGGTVVTRDMVIAGLATLGILQYTWQAADWSDLIVDQVEPAEDREWLHRMEYEVLGGSGFRATFPNGTYDQLKIISDIGQG